MFPFWNTKYEIDRSYQRFSSVEDCFILRQMCYRGVFVINTCFDACFFQWLHHINHFCYYNPRLPEIFLESIIKWVVKKIIVFCSLFVSTGVPILTQRHDKYFHQKCRFVRLRRAILSMTISVHSSFSACTREMFDRHKWQVLIRYFHYQVFSEFLTRALRPLVQEILSH